MTSMAGEIRLTAWRELRRTVRSGKFIACTLLFLIGGALTILGLVALWEQLGSYGITHLPRAAEAGARREALMAVYGDRAIAESLSAAPFALLLMHTATMFFVPLLAILVGFDQIAGELQHKTIRYTALRARRASLVIGKALGAWAVVAAISLLLDVFVWGMLISQGMGDADVTLWFGLRLWLASTLYGGVYVALTTLSSSIFTSPVLALLSTLTAAFGIWLVHVISLRESFPEPIQWLRYLIPGHYDRWLLSPEPLPLLGGVLAMVAFVAAGIGGASLVLTKRDL
jgi:ABC-type transport system involved in multi-copper enzyme maturation permease subunit